MKFRNLAIVAVCVALGLMGAAQAIAQTGTGNINGTVTDPNGDPLPGVTVTLSEGSAMGVSTAVTSASGKYRFQALIPDSNYRITFALDGFRTVVREQIRVQVGATTPLNPVMQLAEMGDEITVIGESPMIDTETVASSTNFGIELLDNVPNNRSWSDAVLAAPGMVAEDGVGTTASARGGSVVNNDVSYDDVRVTNPIYNAHPGGMVYESVEEVQILTGGLPAEFGNANSPTLSVNFWVDLDANLYADPTDYYLEVYNGGTSATVDPNLKQPYTDEIFIGYEQEVFTDFTLGVNLSWRKDNDLIETDNAAISPGSFIPQDVPDPGPDSVFGTADDRTLTVYNQIADFSAANLVTNPETAEGENGVVTGTTSVLAELAEMGHYSESPEAFFWYTQLTKLFMLAY